MSKTVAKRSSRLWLAVGVVVCLHTLCYQAAAPLRRSHALALVTNDRLSSIAKRSFDPPPDPYSTFDLDPTEDDDSDPPHEDAESLIDYMRLWENATPKAKPLIFAAMVVWLIFLFAFVGITASDFFCPNLSTISTRLGMSESVAGVTFLAFSNGSPDVFSTFSALRSDAGALAIGELIGAASFIVSVVAGTMCVIQPFQVARVPFLRDVGFFTVAVTFTLAFLWDSHIHGWEALAMVALYLVYVAVVGLGSWWMSRRERQAEVLRKARSEYAVEGEGECEEYRDDPTISHAPGLATPPRSQLSSPAHTPRPATPNLSSYKFPASPTSPSAPHAHFHQPLDEDTLVSLAERGTPVTLTRTRSGSATIHSPTVRRPKTRSTVRPSLLGAIEFRDVVNSLRADSSARTLAVFGGAGEEHGHASYVGADGVLDRGAVGPKAQTRKGRSASHSGAPRPDHETDDLDPHRPNFEASRRPTWTAEMGGPPWTSGICEEDHGHWGESEDEAEEAEGPLVNLSAGVDNPWEASSQASWGRHGHALRLDIPVYSSSSASTKTLLRKASAASISSQAKPLPSIMLTTEAGHEHELAESKPGFLQFRERRGYAIARAVFVALFPSLQDFGAKSWVGKATALLCVPAILVLNLTLPVVDIEDDECESVENHEIPVPMSPPGYYQDDVPQGPTEGLLIDTADATADEPTTPSAEDQARLARHHITHEFHVHHNGIPNPLPQVHPSPWASSSADLDGVDRRLENFSVADPTSNVDSVPTTPGSVVVVPVKVDLNVTENVLTRWLTAVQCTLGPVFCVTALFVDDLQWWYPIAALSFGLVLGMFAFRFFVDRSNPSRVILCFAGFFVAMVWILMIVNEVVGVLQTMGHIFGLSDAILGLTVFAMGNSLGDLVANATVARMGFPSMAIAACFGGPMLNILLGVGLSGSYLIFTNGGAPLHVPMGRTLIFSGAGLLAVLLVTLVAVPLNGYMMSKRMGWSLITAYVVVLSLNIAVEIWL